MSQTWRTGPDQTSAKVASRRIRKTRRSRPGRGSLALPAAVMGVLAVAFLVWFMIDAPATFDAVREVSASTPLRAPVQPPQIATAPFLADTRTAPPTPLSFPEPAPPALSVVPLAVDLQPTQQILTPAQMTAVVSLPEQISDPVMVAAPAAEDLVPRRTPMAYAASAPTPVVPAPLQAIKPAPKPEPKAEFRPEPKPAPVAAAEEADEDAEKTGRSLYSIILARVPTEGEARAKLGPLKQKFGNLLGGRRLSYHRVKEGGAFVWRVRSAGLSEDDATDICDKIETAGGDCSAVAQ